MRIANEMAPRLWHTIEWLLPLLAWSMAWLISALALPTTALASTAPTERSLLEERVHAFLEQRTRHFGDDVTITLYPGSARLPECKQPRPFLPNFGQRLYGRISVGVRCGEQDRVRYLQAEVSVMTEHVVVAQDIAADTPVSVSDLKLEKARLERLPRNALLEMEKAIGLLAVRALPAGTTLLEQHLRREPLVKRGASVTVFARGAGFSVSREAEALDNGAMGERVRLRTEDGDRLQARVVGRNRLEIVF